MINILVNGLTRTFGGIESLFYAILQYADKDKYHFDFLCFENVAARKDEFEKLGSNVYFIPRPGKDYKGYKKGLENVFKKNKYDIYHVNLTRYKPDYDIKVAKRNGCKIIIHSHLTGINKSEKPIYTFMRYAEFAFYKRPVVKMADLLMACSKNAAKYLFGNLPCHILYNGIDYTQYQYSDKNRNLIRQEFQLSDDDILFGNVGRLTFQKNQEFLIDVFSQVHSRNDKTKLVIVGDGEKYNVLKKCVKEHNLSNAVILTGNRSDVGKILSAFDCFVLPSIREALPISLIEAQVNGLKCIVSDNITHEVDISDIKRVNIIGDATKDWMVALSAVQPRLINHSNRTVDEKFRIERCVDDLESTYERLAL